MKTIARCLLFILKKNIHPTQQTVSVTMGDKVISQKKKTIPVDFAKQYHFPAMAVALYSYLNPVCKYSVHGNEYKPEVAYFKK